MESEVERTLRNLTVISMIKQNDKLITSGDTFAIHPPTVMRSVYRRWYGESRDLNLQHLCATIHTASTTVHKMLRREEEFFKGKEGVVPEERWAASQDTMQCTRLITALQKSKRGLTNLVDTYDYDTSYQVRLQMLCDHIDDFSLSVRERRQSMPHVDSGGVSKSGDDFSSSPLFPQSAVPPLPHNLSLPPAALPSPF